MSETSNLAIFRRLVIVTPWLQAGPLLAAFQKVDARVLSLAKDRTCISPVQSSVRLRTLFHPS